MVQIQPRKPVLDDADNTAPTRQHELDHTDHTDHTDQEYICLKDVDHAKGSVTCPRCETL